MPPIVYCSRIHQDLSLQEYECFSFVNEAHSLTFTTVSSNDQAIANQPSSAIGISGANSQDQIDPATPGAPNVTDGEAAHVNGITRVDYDSTGPGIRRHPMTEIFGLPMVVLTTRPDPLQPLTTLEVSNVFGGLLQEGAEAHIENMKRSLRAICEIELRCATTDGGLLSILQGMADIVNEYRREMMERHVKSDPTNNA